MLSFHPSRLREALKQKNLSQNDLSQITGISKATIHRYMKNLSSPNTDAINQIAKALNLDPYWLIGAPEIREIPLYKNLDVPTNPFVSKESSDKLDATSNFPFLDKNEKYFATIISNDTYANAGIKKGDLLIFRQPNSEIDESSIGLFVANGNLAVLCKAYPNGNNYILTPLTSDTLFGRIYSTTDWGDHFELVGILDVIIHKF